MFFISAFSNKNGEQPAVQDKINAAGAGEPACQAALLPFFQPVVSDGKQQGFKANAYTSEKTGKRDRRQGVTGIMLNTLRRRKVGETNHHRFTGRMAPLRSVFSISQTPLSMAMGLVKRVSCSNAGKRDGRFRKAAPSRSLKPEGYAPEAEAAARKPPGRQGHDRRLRNGSERRSGAGLSCKRKGPNAYLSPANGVAQMDANAAAGAAPVVNSP